MQFGKLILLPNLISDNDWNLVIPNKVRDTIVNLQNIVVEDVRTARRYLRKLGYDGDFSDRNFYVLNKHTAESEITEFIQICMQGEDLGMLSEAGLPCIADPGNSLVEMARSFGLDVVPLTGPSSIFLSLMASGFNGQNFAFVGYLPIDKMDRKKRILELERIIREHDQTQIFIEAPYRNQQLFEALLQTCNPKTFLCMAMNITAENEWIKVKQIEDWKKTKVDISKQNTIFLLYK